MSGSFRGSVSIGRRQMRTKNTENFKFDISVFLIPLETTNLNDLKAKLQKPSKKKVSLLFVGTLRRELSAPLTNLSRTFLFYNKIIN
jgi:hypothetical protein